LFKLAPVLGASGGRTLPTLLLMFSRNAGVLCAMVSMAVVNGAEIQLAQLR
jgi:hypothetical protein